MYCVKIERGCVRVTQHDQLITAYRALASDVQLQLAAVDRAVEIVRELAYAEIREAARTRLEAAEDRARRWPLTDSLVR